MAVNKLVRCTDLTPEQWENWRIERMSSIGNRAGDYNVAMLSPVQYAVYLRADESRPVMNRPMEDMDCNMVSRVVTYNPRPGDEKTAALREACLGVLRYDIINSRAALTVFADRLEEIGDDCEARAVRDLTTRMQSGQLYAWGQGSYGSMNRIE
jgi:hypothetical protein